MRQECEFDGCGEPAVDYITKHDGHSSGKRLYLCAEHWDMMMAPDFDGMERAVRALVDISGDDVREDGCEDCEPGA